MTPAACGILDERQAREVHAVAVLIDIIASSCQVSSTWAGVCQQTLKAIIFQFELVCSSKNLLLKKGIAIPANLFLKWLLQNSTRRTVDAGAIAESLVDSTRATE